MVMHCAVQSTEIWCVRALVSSKNIRNILTQHRHRLFLDKLVWKLSNKYGTLILHPEKFRFIYFNVRFVLSYIYYRHSVNKVDNRQNYLLLQASNGNRLHTIEVRKLFYKFSSQNWCSSSSYSIRAIQSKQCWCCAKHYGILDAICE